MQKLTKLQSLIWLVMALIQVDVRAAEIALIIDDMGNMQQDAAAFALPAQVTFAILPHTPYSQRFSVQAAGQSREVMLHMPMESLNGRRLGPGALTADMHPDKIRQVLAQALKSVPNAVGINNHMGSKLTQLTLPMRTTMNFLHQQGLYFIDSRTTRFSRAALIAQQQGVEYGKRNVFLDHVARHDFIHGQFKRLLELARKQGSAIGIAHPYPQTLAYLQRHLPQLSQHNIDLVRVSQLLSSQQAHH